MVVDDSGNFISQRKEPRMSLVEPCVEGGVLRLRAPGQTDLTVPLTGPPDTAGGLLHCRSLAPLGQEKRMSYGFPANPKFSLWL